VEVHFSYVLNIPPIPYVQPFSVQFQPLFAKIKNNNAIIVTVDKVITIVDIVAIYL
jgi:hypothetical protein